MATHAKFSPSKMQRIIACPGSVALESAYPDKRSGYADEGTVAHHIAAMCLTQNSDAHEMIGSSFEVSATGDVTNHPDGRFKIDQDFADYVQVYVDMVRRMAVGGILLVEQRVYFSEAVGVPDQSGTADAIIIFPHKIVVIDLKFGMGVKVYAAYEGYDPTAPKVPKRYPNEQAATYAVGVLETFGDLIDLTEMQEVTLVISQPRLDHLDEQSFSLTDIHAHKARARNAVLVATVAQKDYEADRDLRQEYFKAGDKQCKFCKAAATCPTLAADVGDLVFEDKDTMATVDSCTLATLPRLPGPDVMGARYGALGLVETWLKAVRAEVDRMVLSGQTVIGPDGERMKAVEGKKGNRAWKDPKAVEQFLTGHMLPDQLYKPREIVGVPAVEKFMKGKTKNPNAVWKDVQTYIHQSPGQPTVVLGSDPRPAWTGEMNDSEFVDLGNESEV